MRLRKSRQQLANEAEFAREVVAASGGLVEKTGSRHGEVRFRPTSDSFEVDDLYARALLAAAGHPVVRMRLPENSGSFSGRFVTYVTESNFYVVFGSRGNAGHRREKSLLNELVSVIAGKSPSEHLSELFRALRITPSSLTSAQLMSSKYVKRRLSRTPADVGSVVADIGITLSDGTSRLLSLKLDSGGGKLSLINAGYTGAFVHGLADACVATERHQYDYVLEAAGLDKEKICRCLTDLRLRRPSRNVVVAPAHDPETLTGLLRSAYGYGYHYVEDREDSWNVVDLTTVGKLKDYLGQARVIEAVYPGVSSTGSGKDCYVARSVIETTTGKRFALVVRNADGRDTVPNKILFDTR